MFHISYPEDIKIVQFRNKNQFQDGKLITDARLLIAADCSAYAYGNFHQKFMRNHITLIGCPKLDDIDYSKKLSAIIQNNDIKSVTVVRMEVPCCGGIEHAVIEALRNSGKMIPWQIVTISADGEIIE